MVGRAWRGEVCPLERGEGVGVMRGGGSSSMREVRTGRGVECVRRSCSRREVGEDRMGEVSEFV